MQPRAARRNVQDMTGGLPGSTHREKLQEATEENGFLGHLEAAKRRVGVGGETVTQRPVGGKSSGALAHRSYIHKGFLLGANCA